MMVVMVMVLVVVVTSGGREIADITVFVVVVTVPLRWW